MRQRYFSGKRILRTLAGLGCLIIVSGIGIGVWLLHDLPSSEQLERHTVRPTSLIVDRSGKLLYESIDPESGRQIDLSLDAIPQACIDATLATEDSRFYQHMGVDPIAISRALLQNVRAGGTIVSGGSTLTQQLVRILLLDDGERFEQSYRRKAREAFLAWRLETRFTKDELLALYLNQSYYGNFAFGLESAARHSSPSLPRTSAPVSAHCLPASCNIHPATTRLSILKSPRIANSLSCDSWLNRAI